MIILHIVRALDVGGLERVVLELAARSRAHGLDVRMVCLHSAGIWGEGHPDVIVLGGRHRWQKVLALTRLARRWQVDILHSHNPEPHLVAVLAGLLSRVPVVHTKHGRNYPGNPRRVWLNRILNRLGAATVAVSADAYAVSSRQEGCPLGKLYLIHNGLDVNAWPVATQKNQQKARQQAGIPEDCFVVGTVGRLSPEKNYDMLLAALRDLRQAGRPVSGVFVGGGEERQRLEDLALQYGIRDHCRFVGEQSDVVSWMHTFDVFCLSSITEGLSITLLEAGACGLPCVVTDVGGNSEVVIDGQSGFLVPSRDANQMLVAFQKLYSDPGMRMQMGMKARAIIAERFSLKKTVSDYISLYQKVCGE